MTIALAALWLPLLLLVPLVLALSVASIRRAQLSLMRYRLWALRDEIADAIYRESVGRKAAFFDLIAFAEGGIVFADKLSLPALRWAATRANALQRHQATNREKRLSELSTPEQERYSQWQRAIGTALIEYLCESSAFGRIHRRAIVGQQRSSRGPGPGGPPAVQSDTVTIQFEIVLEDLLPRVTDDRGIAAFT